jgi:hypothetical protein
MDARLRFPLVQSPHESDTADAEMGRGFGEGQPTFCVASFFAVTRDAVVATQRNHPFPRPAVPHSSEQPVPRKNAGNGIVGANPG